jgi:allophanate hydrolase
MLTMPTRIRAVPGPQIDHFSEDEIAAFFENGYVVGAGSDRMGMRLIGRRIAHRQGFDIVSDGIAPGSVQILGDGQPVVLLADRQTTGGYPKIATIISADIPAVGRLSVGEKVFFEPVTIEVAEGARRRHLAELESIREHIVPLRRSAAEVAMRLLDSNLISGVVDAENETFH